VTIVELAGESTLQEETNMVELVTGVVDYGDAPEIYISGPARVSRRFAAQELFRQARSVAERLPTGDGGRKRKEAH
jgi:hypothetical protein